MHSGSCFLGLESQGLVGGGCGQLRRCFQHSAQLRMRDFQTERR